MDTTVIPAKDDLVVRWYTDFIKCWTFTESISDKEFFFEVRDTTAAQALIATCSITQDNAAKTIVAYIDEADVNDIALGEYQYDVKSRSLSSGIILPEIEGKFTVVKSITRVV
jgi:hypothetical protein